VLRNATTGESLSRNTNGAWTFATQQATGASYNVTVQTQPTGQTCTVANGSGTVGSSNVTNVAVTCATNSVNYFVNANIAGSPLTSPVGLHLNGQYNGFGALGTYQLQPSLPNGSSYNVTIAQQPSGMTCVLTNANGVINGANVAVGVNCAPTQVYAVGGNLSGLVAGQSVVLRNATTSETLSRNTNGAWTFATQQVTGASYSVTVQTQPVGQTCTVANGSGTVGSSNVTNIVVTCSSGALTTLSEGFEVLPNGCPAGWVCNNMSNPLGTTNWTVGSSSAFPAQGGSATSFIAANFQSVSGVGTISNWLITPHLTFSSGAQIRFWTRVPLDSAYADRLQVRLSTAGSSVNVGTTADSIGDFTTLLTTINPSLMTGSATCPPGSGPYPHQAWCEIVLSNANGIPSSGSGRIALLYYVTNAGPDGANGNYVGVDTFSYGPASSNQFTVGGSISGLGSGLSVVLRNATTGESLSRNANGTYTFTTTQATGANYNITVQTQPTGQTCTVANGSGTVGAANVTNVNVTCTTNVTNHTVGGSISGLGTGLTVVLRNATTGESISRNVNGPFTFSNSQATGSNYNVTVLTQPAGQSCTVANGVGTVGSGNVTNINVTCAPVQNNFSVLINVTGTAFSGGLVVSLNGIDSSINGPGSWLLANNFINGQQYGVSVRVNPTGLTCIASNASGTINGANVTVPVDCSPSPGPFPENFEDANLLTALDARGWRIQNNSSPVGTWTWFAAPAQQIGGMAPMDGGYISVGYNSTGQTGVLSNWLIAPPVTHQTGQVLEFWTRTSDIAQVYPDRLEVRYSVGAGYGLGSSASDIGSFNVLLATINPQLTTENVACASGINVPMGGSINGYPRSWCRIQVQLPLGGTGRVAFRYFVTDGGELGTNSNAIGIDSVRVQTGVPQTFVVGGNLTGLAGGQSVVLRNSVTGESLSRSSNGAWNFTNAQVTGANYNVTVLTQPTGQTCMVANGTGTVGSANIGNINVTCTTNTYTVGGSISGLGSGLSVVLRNATTGESVSRNANGTYTFATAQVTGASYNVTVQTQPTGQTCAVANGSGTVGSANISTVNVTCTTNTYTVGGSISGLGSGLSVVLRNATTGESLSRNANGAYSFATAQVTGASYNVTVLTQPTGQTCMVANGTGTVGSANIGNINVTCTTNTYRVGGSISGLGSGLSVVLRNATTGESLSRSANGTYTFATAQVTGASYNVTVLTQPTGQTCAVANGSGTVGSANISNVNVTCTTNTYTVGGSISGLGSGLSVVLRNATTGENLSRSANGAYTFSTAQATGATYNVTVLTQPTGQVCIVANGSNTIGTANVTNVNVTCQPLGSLISNPAAGTTLDFGSVQHGQHRELTVTLGNGAAAGGTSFAIIGCTLSGAGYTRVDGLSFPQTLNPAGSIVLRVRLSATAALSNPVFGTLSCTHNALDGGGNVSWSLSGRSIAESLFESGFESP